MDKQQVIDALRAHEADIRAGGATSLYLFGSVVRGEAGPESDVDVFMDYDPSSKFSLIEPVGLQHDIEGMLGAKVDLLTRASLHPVLRSNILAEAERVF
jgi:predicted nucleotidyltransferase